MDNRVLEYIRSESKAVIIYNNFCRRKQCPEYVEWDFDYGECISCKLAGQSYHITKFPEDCLHKDEIEKETTMTVLKGEKHVL